MSARHSKPYKTINSTLSQPQQTLYLKSCIFCSPTAGFRVKFIFSSLSARLTELMFANQRFYEARSQEGKFINLLQNIKTFFSVSRHGCETVLFQLNVAEVFMFLMIQGTRACFIGQSGQYPPLSPSPPLPGDQLKLLTVTLLQSCISSSPGETWGLLVNDVIIITVLSHVICRNISVYCCSLSNRIVKICVYMDKSW